MGNGFEKWLNVDRNTATPILAGGINSFQEEPVSIKGIIHEVFDKELLVPCVSTIKYLNHSFPQSKDLFLSSPGSDTDGIRSQDLFPVNVSFPGARIISRRIRFRSASSCQVVRELAGRAVSAISTLEFPAEFVALMTGPEVIRPASLAGMAFASESPVSTVSHDRKGGNLSK